MSNRAGLTTCTLRCLNTSLPKLAVAGDGEQNGNDFWYTRNGHGVGFWDRGYEQTGDRLTEAAHKFGAHDLCPDEIGQTEN